MKKYYWIIIIIILVLAGIILIEKRGKIPEEMIPELRGQPLTGWLFSVDTLEGEKLFFVIDQGLFIIRDSITINISAGHVFTEEQIKKITELDSILPLRNLIPGTEEEIKIKVKNHIEKIVAELKNYKFEKCFEDCLARYCYTTEGEKIEDCPAAEEAQTAEKLQPVEFPYEIARDECSYECPSNENVSAEIECLNSLTIEKPKVIWNIHINRIYPIMYVPVYYKDIYYGYYRVIDSSYPFASVTNLTIIEGEDITKCVKDVDEIPTDEKSKAFLLEYMKKNNISGEILEGIYAVYEIKNYNELKD